MARARIARGGAPSASDEVDITSSRSANAFRPVRASRRSSCKGSQPRSQSPLRSSAFCRTAAAQFSPRGDLRRDDGRSDRRLNAGSAVVPIAFQSALAGIGLAADLVKHAAGLPMPASTSTRMNLLRPLAPVLPIHLRAMRQGDASAAITISSRRTVGNILSVGRKSA